MNSSEGVSQPYQHQELLDSLEFNTLYQLGNTLRGDWMQVIRKERVNRERSLEALRTYQPTCIEAPPYTGQDLDGYLVQARMASAAAAGHPSTIKLPAEKGMVQQQAYSYLISPGTIPRLSSLTQDVGLGELADFFADNIYGVVSTARSEALRRFEAERDSALYRCFPGIHLPSYSQLISSVKLLPITAAQIKAATNEVHALCCRAAYPDFFQMTADQQTAIVKTLAKDWEELCLLVHATDPQLLRVSANRSMAPLAYLPARALRDAIQANPEVDPAKLCYAFLRTPNSFAQQIDKLKSQAAAAAVLRQAYEDLGLEPGATISTGETTVVSKNQYEIDKLLSDPDIRPAAQRLGTGMTVLLTDLDKLIPRAKLEDVIDKHLQLIGRTFYEDLDTKNPRGVMLSRWKSLNAGEALRAGFEGPMRNLTITRLPVTEDILVARFGQDREGITTDNTYQLVLAAEMKSTGRKPQTALLPMLLVMRSSDSTRDHIYKTTWAAGKSNGQQIVESLQAEASAIAILLEAKARSVATSAGLPGLGKRKP